MTAKRLDSTVKAPVLWRGWLLYLLPLPLLPATLTALGRGELVLTLARGAAFALTLLAATLIRKGIRLDNETARRRLRRRASTVRYRLIGAVAVAAGMFILARFGLSDPYSLLGSVMMAGAVLLGARLYYDFDVIKGDPRIAAIGITAEELIELLDEAEERISGIEHASTRIPNAEFRDRLRRIASEARSILDTIENDPVDARRARKFLKVYLDGAQQVTEGYARSHKSDKSHALEDNFRRVLTTIEVVIHEQQEKLSQNNLTELDVQIEVLQEQLEREGVT